MSEPQQKQVDESTWMESAQFLLAEKRTSLSVLRTGTSIFVLPLSVLSLLIATAKVYQGQQVLHLLVPLLVICGGLTVLSIFLITRSIRNLRKYDRLLREIKLQHPSLRHLMD